MNENKTDPDINSTGRRVTPEEVAAYMERVEYSTGVPVGTTSTFTHSYLRSKDGKRLFYLASGHSACVVPENFDAARGIDIARGKCEEATKNAICAMLGFQLFQELDA